MPPGEYHRYTELLAGKLTISVTSWQVDSVASSRNQSIWWSNSWWIWPNTKSALSGCFFMNCNNSVVFCRAISSSQVLFTGTGRWWIAIILNCFSPLFRWSSNRFRQCWLTMPWCSPCTQLFSKTSENWPGWVILIGSSGQLGSSTVINVECHDSQQHRKPVNHIAVLQKSWTAHRLPRSLSERCQQ